MLDLTPNELLLQDNDINGLANENYIKAMTYDKLNKWGTQRLLISGSSVRARQGGTGNQGISQIRNSKSPRITPPAPESFLDSGAGALMAEVPFRSGSDDDANPDAVVPWELVKTQALARAKP
jgi:hypothetical protein